MRWTWTLLAILAVCLLTESAEVGRQKRRKIRRKVMKQKEAAVDMAEVAADAAEEPEAEEISLEPVVNQKERNARG